MGDDFNTPSAISVLFEIARQINTLKKKNKLGGQNKIPRLSNDRIYIDEMKKLIKFFQ